MPNISRWFNYAKARIDSAIGQGHRDLDELEAQREVELADKPWLRSTGDAPTFDEARARIEWEAEQASRRARGEADRPAEPPTTPAHAPTGAGEAAPVPGPGPAPARPAAQGSGPDGAATGSSPLVPITSPEERAAAAEAASARLEMEARQRESAARLDAIREELGIDPPDGGAPSGN